MHTGDLCFFTGASLFIVGVVGYFFTGPNNKGVYLLSSFVFFVSKCHKCMYAAR